MRDTEKAIEAFKKADDQLTKKLNDLMSNSKRIKEEFKQTL